MAGKPSASSVRCMLGNAESHADRTRRRQGKTDTLDAESAARAVLSGRASARRKTGDGPVEMLRMFKLAKDSAVKARSQAINQLKAVLVAADPTLRETLSGPEQHAAHPSLQTTRRGHALRYHQRRGLHPAATGPAHPGAHQARSPSWNTTSPRVTSHAARLLTRRGIGPDNTAALLIAAGDNPDRLRSETSFAALCGVSPLEASSGKTSRRRLNRGGDRQANSALYRITICRLRWDTRTRNYLTRRITEGKTRREAIRCLKALHRPRDLPNHHGPTRN